MTESTAQIFLLQYIGEDGELNWSTPFWTLEGAMAGAEADWEAAFAGDDDYTPSPLDWGHDEEARTWTAVPNEDIRYEIEQMEVQP